MTGDSKKTVLIVEDERFLSNLLKARLEAEGINVIQAFDGDAAMKELRRFRPDLILLDIIIPKISGFELMEAINSDPQLHDGPIIIISNLGQDADIEKGKSLGAIEYFIKAKVSMDELVKRIKSFLDEKD